VVTAETSKETEGTRLGVSGRELHWREWNPVQAPRAVVVVSHGYAEHGGRYARLAADFADRGLATCAIDHHGHGLSEGKPVSVRRFDDYVDDFAAYVEDVRQRYGVPLFVLGHSMGGLIALRYVTRDHPAINGLIISGTAAIRPDDISGLTVAMGRLLSKVAPDAGIVTLPLGQISHDDAVVKAYNEDPLVHAQKMRARLGAEILDTIARVEVALPEMTEPVLILHGSDDAISPVESSRFVHGKAGSGDKTLKIYDGLWHEVFNEPQRGDVIKDVTDWIDNHLGLGLGAGVS
jgi:alpha-beta hydrolase superfamily lysophospholipase